ncbi:MAG: DUF2892 domain-containing protein [Phycisphaerales bacterium]
MLNCKNVGTVDRVIRALIGVTALVLAFTAFHLTEGAIAGIVAAIIGVVMLLTAALATCPLYVPLKLSTCGAKTTAR